MIPKKRPTPEQCRLVAALADGLCDYWGEDRGNAGCHIQAAAILINEMHDFADYEPIDFFKVIVDEPDTGGAPPARSAQPKLRSV